MSDRTAQQTPPVAPPRYKLAVLSWAGAYGLITLIIWLLGPAMADWPLMLRTLLISVLMAGALTWVVLPALTRLLAREKLGRDAGEAGRLLDRSRQELDEALKEIRELARGLHPTLLSDRGLGPAVEALAHRAPLPVEVGGLPAERLPEQVELAAYFVVSEALTNVAKHASATHASVTSHERQRSARGRDQRRRRRRGRYRTGDRHARSRRPLGRDRGPTRRRLQTRARNDPARQHPMPVAPAAAPALDKLRACRGPSTRRALRDPRQ